MMEFILSHVEKGVMTLTLNRPERLNSFNDEMHAQLAECLKQVERDDTIRCLLLTGAGRGFCSRSVMGICLGPFQKAAVPPDFIDFTR